MAGFELFLLFLLSIKCSDYASFCKDEWMNVLGPDLIKETPIQVTWSPFAVNLQPPFLKV